MYESIRIQNFRGLKDLTIENLGRVNLLVGANNVGKTSVLEALALLRMHRDGYEFVEILESRGFDENESLRESVTSVLDWDEGYGGYVPASITATDGRGERHRLIISQNEGRSANGFRDAGDVHVSVSTSRDEYVRLAYAKRPPDDTSPFTIFATSGPRTITLQPGTVHPFPAITDVGPNGDVVFIPAHKRLGPSALAELVSEVQDRGNNEELVKSLREFDTRVEEVNVRYERVERQATVTVAVRETEGRITRQPITSLGDGTRRLVELRLLLLTARGGIALIDEVESGIYYENLDRLWSTLNGINNTVEVQLFATTHSLECVQASLRSFDGPTRDDFRLFRLERNGDQLEAVDFTHEDLAATLSLNFEFR